MQQNKQDTRFHMRVEPEFLQLMRETAETRGQTLSEFVRLAVVVSIAKPRTLGAK